MNYLRSRSVATGLAMVILLAGCGKSPESTVESFYRAVAKGELTEAKSYLSAQIVGLIGERKLDLALASEAQRVQKCGGIKGISVTLSGEGEIRSGSVAIQYGSCPPRQERTRLVKEEGKWKIGAEK